MKKEFVPYEQSLALKELGFDEPCLTYYFSDGAFNDAAEEDDTLYQETQDFILILILH